MTAPARLAPRARRTAVAVMALLLIGAAITSLTIVGAQESGLRPRKPAARPLARKTTTRSPPHRLAPPVRSAQLVRARDAAERFLGTFLPFAYGRPRAAVVRAVTPALRRRLTRERAAITPVEPSRRPRVVWLWVVGMTPGFVLATATVTDGGITTYVLRFTLQARGGRWSVNGLQQG
jgi:hypothetical protein